MMEAPGLPPAARLCRSAKVLRRQSHDRAPRDAGHPFTEEEIEAGTAADLAVCDCVRDLDDGSIVT